MQHITNYPDDVVSLDHQLRSIRRVLRERGWRGETLDVPSQKIEETRAILVELLDEFRLGLKQHAVREEQELFPKVEQILGADLEEVSDLCDDHAELEERLDEMLASLDAPLVDDDGTADTTRMRTFLEIFDAFVEAFRTHSMHEATFFHVNHHLLFPESLFTG
jgi:iron-sulfur cluster repair protein YtfE (RIC family)